MASPLITSAFARIGDTRNPPQTDSTGAVNWDNGYTPNYEIDLSSGDPLAKPVERDVMNYLFNILTDNTRQYQRTGNPEWYSNMPNGYPIGAIVLVAVTGGYDLYRSLSDNNTNNPVGSSAWDKIWTSAQIRGIIPMPLGGQQVIPGGVLSAGANVKTLSDGTYIVPSDSVAANITNLPVSKSGVLEVRNFSNGGVATVMARFNSTDNNSYYIIDTPTGNAQWNRSISSLEIGNTPGLIPRISATGISINNQSPSFAFGIQVSSGSDGKYSAISTNSLAAVGDFVTQHDQSYNGNSLKFGMRLASGSTISDCGIQINGSDRLLFDKAVYGRIFTRTSDWQISGANPKVTLMDQNQVPFGVLQAESASGGRQISIAIDSVKFSVNEVIGATFTGRFAADTLYAAKAIYINDVDSGLSSSADGSVNFIANGDDLGGWSTSAATGPSFLFRAPVFGSSRFSAQQIFGRGTLVSQYNSSAPFSSEQGSVPNTDNSYYPAVKGRVITQSAGGVAYSFGYVTSGVSGVQGSIAIQGIDHNAASKAWYFDLTNGGFRVDGPITAQSVTLTGGLSANGITSTSSITAATTIWSGNGSARFNADGNIQAPLWLSGSLYADVTSRLSRDGATYAGFASGNINQPYLRHEQTGQVVLLQRANQFSANIPGLFKDTSTGMLMQWGRVDNVVDDTPAGFTFPVAFPGFILSFTCSLLRGSRTADTQAMLSVWGSYNQLAGASGGTVIFQSNSSASDARSGDICWLAIGY